MNLIRTSEEAYYTSDPWVSVTAADIERLKAEVNSTARKRIRICLHRDINERLHEFFIIYTDKTLVQPHKHLAKDESMRVMEGAADVVFYNETGDVTKIIPMGVDGTFYVRIPANTYHTLVMRSEMLVLYVATPGPYRREETLWASWWKPA